MTARFREHRLKSGFMAAVGLWISNLVVTEMTESAWVVSPPVAGVILVGGTLGALLIYLTGAPSFIARGNADFWEGGVLLHTLVEVAYSAVVALTWSIVLLLVLGTRVSR